MSTRFEELDWQRSPLGEVSLRRRVEPSLGVDVYEVKLDDEYLMSSLFTAGERELARIALAEVDSEPIDVLVGGLGLGYTALTAREDPRVGSLTVLETVPQVIEWHERELLPDAAGLATDPRVQLRCADFFAVIRGDEQLPDGGAGRYDAVLLDIDHTPDQVLHRSHAQFYTEAGLRSLLRHLRPHGVFALWSDDPPDEAFCGSLATVFDEVTPHVVRFDNPLTGGQSANTVYVALGPRPVGAAGIEPATTSL